MTSDLESSAEIQPWFTFLTNKASVDAEEGLSDVVNIFKDFLSGRKNALETAKQIDEHPTILPYRHLSFFYWMLFDTAAVIPYNDPTQDKLSNLIIELLRLPPRKFKTQAGEVSYHSHASVM